jgi:Tol biopolymer transport system component
MKIALAVPVVGPEPFPRRCRPVRALAGLALLTLLGLPTQAAERPVTSVQALSSLKGNTQDISLVMHEGTNMAAAPSPDGQRIAFTAQGALWMLPITGGTATRLTDWTMEPTAPVWSPDGGRIAFQNYDAEGNYHLWTLRPDGSGLTRITSGPFDDREPCWTPDGKALVFASDRSQDGQYKIWQIELASGQYQALTHGAGAESSPAISPDGKLLAFTDNTAVAGTPQFMPPPARIYTQPLDRSETARLIGPGSMPAFAPDGSGLIYQSARRGIQLQDKLVASGEDLFPFPIRWLPDGRWLYTADGKIKIHAPQGEGLGEVPFQAHLALRRPVLGPGRDRGFDRLGTQPVRGISSPAISPDGQHITFVALNDVWVMKIGQAPVRLTDDLDRDGSPQFTPDGKAVYFSTEKDNSGALAIDQIDLATRVRTRLAAAPAKSMVTPKMSPAGDRIAYSTGWGTIEVWNLATGKSEHVIDAVAWQVGPPSWTADGSRIAVVDNERINNRFREGYNKLRVIDVASHSGRFYSVAPAPQQISDREEGAAVVSPDGRLLAFIMDSRLHVMALQPDGSPVGKPKAITREAADLPSWAGDSHTLLYKAGEQLKTIHADGTGAAEVPLPLHWQQAVAPRTTVVHAGILWTGVDAQLLRDVDIVIEANRIQAIRPHDPAAAADPRLKFIDASALTVLPGLWDPHFHPLTLYQGGQYGQVAAAMLAFGITSVQSVAGPLHQSLEMREALDAGNLLGPRLFTAPPLWEGNRLFYSFARTLRTPEVADMEIAKARAMGVDYMKSYVRAPIPIMHKIAQAALEIGIPTGTHMLSPGSAVGLAGTTHLSATQRMGYGWSKSVHGLNSYQDAIAVHAHSHFRVVDTLFSSLALVGADPALIADDRFKLLIPPHFMQALRHSPPPSAATMDRIRHDAEQSAKVQRAGGLLAMGTDSPLVAPGIALHTNLRAAALVSSNVQALQNVTINAAKMSLLDKDLGTVEVGKLADLAMVRGNPLQDLKAAADVRYVVKNGVVYALDDILAPFRTPQALVQRAHALQAYQQLCGRDALACSQLGHAH